MPLSGNPNVNITLTGLLVFCFDPEKPACQVGVLNVPAHDLRIETGKKSPQEPVPTMTSLDAAGELGAGPIRIEVIKPQIQDMILYFDSKFEGKEEDDKKDFRWLVDIEEVHKKPHSLKEGNFLSPIIHLNNGFFYTHEVKPVRLIPPGAETGPARNIANTIGVNIYFDDPDSQLVLSYGVDGAKKLVLKNEPDTTHLITILNNCPPDDLGANSNDPDLELDFKFYYKAFDVLEADRFVMKVPDGADLRGHPCGPIKTSSISGN